MGIYLYRGNVHLTTISSRGRPQCNAHQTRSHSSGTDPLRLRNLDGLELNLELLNRGCARLPWPRAGLLEHHPVLARAGTRHAAPGRARGQARRAEGGQVHGTALTMAAPPRRAIWRWRPMSAWRPLADELPLLLRPPLRQPRRHLLRNLRSRCHLRGPLRGPLRFGRGGGQPARPKRIGLRPHLQPAEGAGACRAAAIEARVRLRQWPRRRWR